ncbi:MAG: MOSC domain-containing protein [Alphaproteobacteria bacterium]|nr:MOSC domain-containing protein [Alphaproteobacteria bacterium]
MAYVKEISTIGRVEACLLSPHREKGLEKSPTDALTLTFDGIHGDCHSGATMVSDARTMKQYPRGITLKNRRQVSIVSVEEMADIADKLAIPSLPPEWVGANLLVSGIPDLTILPPSTRMMFSSGATLIIDLENQPCKYPAEIIENHHPGHGSAFVAMAKNKRGLVAWVEREGKIASGDTIRLFLPPQRLWNH